MSWELIFNVVKIVLEITFIIIVAVSVCSLCYELEKISKIVSKIDSHINYNKYIKLRSDILGILKRNGKFSYLEHMSDETAINILNNEFALKEKDNEK